MTQVFQNCNNLIFRVAAEIVWVCGRQINRFPRGTFGSLAVQLLLPNVPNITVGVSD
jgi:hypothetical protein